LYGIVTLFLAAVLALAVFELRTLQKNISRNSSTGKTLKMLVPMLCFCTVGAGNGGLSLFAFAFVPWLRHRAWTLFSFLIFLGWTCVFMMGGYELSQLHKRKAMHKQQHQIVPLHTNTGHATRTSTIASAVAATKQALQSQKQVRREATASLVLDSGVSLAFLELFLHEHTIHAAMTANDVVNKHVKPHTKEIGSEGSGANVELIGDGVDSEGRRWCGTPTHMLSYSWSYSVVMIVAALRNFEQEHPPSKGQQCNYYFVDQFALNQHEFAKDCTQKQIEDMMLATLKESIAIPGKMICLLHPWADPVPFRRVWCLFELYIAMTLKAQVIMHFPREDAEGFYSKLRKEEVVATLAPTSRESKALVPTIDASQAQASVESDRVRIFQEITDSIGMEQFNSQLQEYLERSLRAVATEALLERGGVESAGAGGSRATLAAVRGELEEAKNVLIKGQEATKAELKAELKTTKQEVTATKEEVKAELMVLAVAQDEAIKETKQEVKETKQEIKETKQEIKAMGGRIGSLEAKIDRLLGLMEEGGRTRA
jgi:hypothetical protein